MAMPGQCAGRLISVFSARPLIPYKKPMKFSILSALLVAPLSTVSAAGQPVPGGRPNILHIHADDHRPDGLHALGNALAPDTESRHARRARHDLHALLHDGLDGRRGLHAEPHDDAHRPLVAAHPEGAGRGSRMPPIPRRSCRESSRQPAIRPGTWARRATVSRRVCKSLKPASSTMPAARRRKTIAPIAASDWPTAPSSS